MFAMIAAGSNLVIVFIQNIPFTFCCPQVLKSPHFVAMPSENEDHGASKDLTQELWEQVIDHAQVNEPKNKLDSI